MMEPVHDRPVDWKDAVVLTPGLPLTIPGAGSDTEKGIMTDILRITAADAWWVLRTVNCSMKKGKYRQIPMTGKWTRSVRRKESKKSNRQGA